jgi:predicted GNAT superfamily acetyltransferase
MFGSLKIRDVRIDDLNDLLELNQSNLPHVGSISMSDMAHLHRQAVYFRVAEFEDQTAGFLIAFDPQADYNSLNFQWFKKRYKAFVVEKVLPSGCTKILNNLPRNVTSPS